MTPPGDGPARRGRRSNRGGQPRRNLLTKEGRLTRRAITNAENRGELSLAGYDLTEIPDEVFQLTGLTSLNLSHNRLTSLPENIGSLTRLLELRVEHNRLESLPPQIGALSGLNSLSLDDNKLRVLPGELRQLGRLTSLTLTGNELEALPANLSGLRELRALWLDGNQLAKLPRGIGALANLRSLRLGGNRLAALPGAIGRLIHLNTLRLEDNELTELPPELGNLGDLHLLRLDGNRLSALPGEVTALTSLQTLNLARNQFTVLPAEVTELSGLQELRLDDNQLTALPGEVTALTSLQTLNLARNRLTSVPAELAGLGALQELRLDGNQIASLPPALADPLERGLILVLLPGNPLDEPLPDLTKRGPQALAAYLRGLQRAVEQYEAKVLLLGEGNVGKTSLSAALRGEPFVDRRPSTPGIDIAELDLSHPDKRDVTMHLRLWDFGGQEHYRITHQLFISERALYLVLWYPREGWIQGNAEAWLRGIMIRTGRDETGRTLIVATHSDDSSHPTVDLPRLEREFPGMLAGHFQVDSKTGDGVPGLRRAIAREAAGLPQMGMPIGKEWAAARAAVLALAQTKAHIPFDEFADVCEHHRVPRGDAAALAGLMHDLGQIVYYGADFGLSDVVVLRPEWLTRVVSAVLDDGPTRRAGGVLDYARLPEIWRDADGLPGYPPYQYPFFLRLLEKFDVSYRLDEGHSLIAQLVPPVRPELPWDFRTLPAPGTRSLVLRCRLSEEAPGLIPWLTVRWHRASTGRHWRSGVFLRYQPDDYESEALLELHGDRELMIEVRAPAPDFFFNVLIDSLHYLLGQRWPGLEYDLLVPCPTRNADGTPCTGEYRLEFLMRRRAQGRPTAGCQVCLEDNDVERLLTGFPHQVPLSEDLEKVNDLIARVSEQAEAIGALAAWSANATRMLLGAAQQEVDDCPRLFTITRERKGSRNIDPFQRHYRLVLWCEHPGGPHPMTERAYPVGEARTWFAAVKPYLKLVLATIEIALPAARVGSAYLSAQQIGQVENDLGIMRDLLRDSDALRRAGAEPGDVTGDGRQLPGSSFTVAEGEALRALRQLVFAHDPARHLAGLRRWLMASGEYRWLCPEHYAEYNPGLPQLPAVPQPVPQPRALPQDERQEQSRLPERFVAPRGGITRSSEPFWQKM